MFLAKTFAQNKKFFEYDTRLFYLFEINIDTHDFVLGATFFYPQTS
jgi:hypothetical protein